MLRLISYRQKMLVMVAVVSSVLLVSLDQTIITTALGTIVTEFNNFSGFGFVVTAYLLTSTVTIPLAGKFSDMYGRKPTLIAGVAIFTIGSLLSGLSGNIEQLVAWRALQGIGGGIIMANAFTIIGDLFEARERGKWQGIIGATFGMSAVIGPLLGGWLTTNNNFLGLTTNWRWTFFINVPVGILAFFIITKYLPLIKHDQKHYPDYMGAGVLTIALSALILAVDNTETVFSGLINQGINLGFIKTILWVTAIGGLLLFVFVEKKAKQPIIPLRFFANKTFVISSIVSLLFGAAFLGSLLYLTQFNQQVFSASPSEAGMMLLPLVLAISVTSITSGQLVAKFGKTKIFITTGLLISTISILALVTMGIASPYWQESIIMVFIGIGFGMILPNLNLIVQNEFDHKDLGVATSSVQLFRGLGSTVGTAVFSGLLTVGIINAIGKPEDIAYIQTLKKSSESSQLISGELSADALLQLNNQKTNIENKFEQSLASTNLPENYQQSILNDFIDQQQKFSNLIVSAFAESLHRIFMISAGIMFVGFCVSMFLKNKIIKKS